MRNVSWRRGTWDVAGWARTGIRPAPLLEFQIPQREGRQTLETTRRFAHENGAGLEISVVASAWVLRGELSFLQSPDPDVGRAVIWAWGGERPVRDGSFVATIAGNALETPINKLFLVLPGFALALDQPERWGGWKLAWIGSFEPAGALFKADLLYSLDDHWKLELGMDFPHGSKRSAFGALSQARRFRIGTRVDW